MNKHRLTKEQKEFIFNNMNATNRNELARNMNISKMTLYRYIREFGGILDVKYKTHHIKDIEQRVIDLYPDYMNPEISEMTGYSINQISGIRRKYNLHKSHKIVKMIQDMMHEASVCESAKIKRAKKCCALRKLDKILMLGGMKQHTQYRFTKWNNRKTYSAIQFQCFKNNYFQYEDEPYTLYYDKNTKRSKKEYLLVKRYGVKFKESN